MDSADPPRSPVSNAKSPLFSHFGDAIAGLVSVRAYGAESKVRKEAIRRVDRYVRTIVIFYVRFVLFLEIFADG